MLLAINPVIASKTARQPRADGASVKSEARCQGHVRVAGGKERTATGVHGESEASNRVCGRAEAPESGPSWRGPRNRMGGHTMMAFETIRRAGHSWSEPTGRGRDTAFPKHAAAERSCRRRDCPPGPSAAARPARPRGGGLGAALFALAALLLAPPFVSDASAQDEYTEVWSATMTAGAGTVDSTSADGSYPNVGYRSGAFGTLSDRTFTFDGETYTIRQISWAINARDNGSRTHILYIAFDMRQPYVLPGRAHQNLVFRGGGFDIQLSDNNPEPAGFGSSWGVYKYWFVANPNWSAGDSIEVSFVVPNRPLFDASPSAHHLVLSEDPPRYAGDSRRARNVRPSVEAIDPGGDTVRYTLEGRDAALFTIDENTGQIRTRADGVYDYETETRSCTQYFHQGPNRLSPCYEATVRATASGSTPATGGVTIELLDGRDGGLRNLRVEAPAGTSRELQVSWDAASPDEQPDAYHVYWNTVDALSDRWFRTIVEGDGTGVLLQSLEANTEYRVQVQTRVGDVLGRRSETLLAGTGGGTPRNSKLSAEFQDVPPKHNSPFTVEVHFSEEVSLSYTTLRDHAFTVTNGAVTGARRLTPPSNIA